MFKNLRSIIVLAFLFSLASNALAQNNPDSDLDAARAKARIANLGTGKTARVKIKMRDKSSLKGFVSEAKNEGFVLTNEKTGATTEISYLQIEQVVPLKERRRSSAGAIILKTALLIGVLALYGLAYGDG